MRLTHIEAFIMLCQEKNITRCSEKLHISQQGLSRQIKAMEQDLGVSLFIRSSHGVTPTPEALVLLPSLIKCEEAYQQGLDDLKKYSHHHRQALSVAVCPGIKQAFGLELFKRFQENHPEIHLKLIFLSDIECEEALYQKKVDAAFLDWPEHEDLYHCYLVVKSPLVAVMRKDHALSHRKSLSMKDLKGLNIYIPDESHRMAQRFKKNWPEYYQSVVIDFTTNEYESFYQDLPLMDGGVALTFSFLCHHLDDELIALPIQEKSYVQLYYCTRKLESESLKKLTHFIKNNIQKPIT